jgi:hypothetical protein
MIQGYKVAPRSRVDLERTAAGVRRGLDLDPLMPLPGIRLFESLGLGHVTIDSHRIDLTYAVEDVLPDAALACARYDEETDQIAIVLSEATYDELECADGRARFSLAHELCHACAHARTLIQLMRIDHKRLGMLRSDSGETPAYRDSEWQANYFAGAILMPAPGLEYLALRGQLTVSKLRTMYSVSKACAEIRIKVFSAHEKDLILGWN